MQKQKAKKYAYIKVKKIKCLSINRLTSVGRLNELIV